MAKKIDDDKKVGGVRSTRETRAVKELESVDQIKGVNAAGGVGSVQATRAARSRQATRTMSLEEREQLFKLINEEAEALFKGSGMSNQQKEMVQNAVKMAVDAGLLESLDDEELEK